MKGRRITVLGLGILITAISFSSSLLAATQTGIASVYSDEQTANGEYAHASALTAAHRTLPFGTMVEVTNSRPAAPSSSASMIVAPTSGVE
jgi:rare lipoprotein A